VSGGAATPYWSGGAFTVASNQSFSLSAGNVTITGVTDAATTLTLPSGALSFPQGIVAGDILYANGAGTLTRLAGPGATGRVLISGVSAPSWSTSLPVTDLTLSGDLAVNGGDITSTATTFNLLNATVTTLNMLAAAATLNIGTDAATVRAVNMHANLTVGSSTNVRTTNLYGTTNFMGATGTGYRIEYNSTDNSMDFIKN